jgi:hypothetical protein
MIDLAKQHFHHNFFTEVFIIVAWHIWKQRNGLIFDRCPSSVISWKNNFKAECVIQAHRMKDTLKTAFLTWSSNQPDSLVFSSPSVLLSVGVQLFLPDVGDC